MTDEQPPKTETDTATTEIDIAAESDALAAAEATPEVDAPTEDDAPAEPDTPTEDDAPAEPDTTTEIGEAPAKSRRSLRRALRAVKVVPILLVVLLVASGGAAVWLYFKQFRLDQQTGPAAAKVALTAASDGTVALLSYSFDTLDKDFAAARSHLTGDFLSYYDKFSAQTVAPAAKQKGLKTTAHVVRAGISELRLDSAVVLIFVDQSTTTKEYPGPTLSASSILVRMSQVNGKWLINKFDPV